MNKSFLVYDGALFASNSLLLRTGNRAFRYGDGLYETMHYHKGSVLFFDFHCERLLRAMATMQLSVKGFISHTALHESIINLVMRNRIFGDAVVRLSVFRKETGTFGSESQQASWIIETVPLEIQSFTLNEKGIKVQIFTDFPKHVSPLSPFRTLSAEPYVFARLWCTNNRMDDCLIVNGQGKIIESSCSNIFWIKEKVVYTPKIASGCIDGVVRRTVLNLLHHTELKAIETEGVTLRELHDADELFMTDTIRGVRWVASLNEKRFYCRVTKEIFGQLYSRAFS
ncbi:MAG: aminotransferase class IV [Cytophagaceae bacterium]|jgi:branched-chain amino acid aminotransferase|nr:aminotransferase class IV [Cytophagaceae bacterium]